jgi:hypothetical protein
MDVLASPLQLHGASRMKKKANPAAGGNRSGVGFASEPWTHADLKPLRIDLKAGDRYLAHTRFDVTDFEVPNTERWEHRSILVEVVGVGPGWVAERALTFNRVIPGYDGDYQRPVRPRVAGWRRRREVE